MGRICEITGKGSMPDNGKNILICCHPEDCVTAEILAADISEYADCAFWKIGECGENMPASELSGMQLFAVAVTEKLVNDTDRISAETLEWARKNDIPLLPVLMKKGLEEAFLQRFGEEICPCREADDYSEMLQGILGVILGETKDPFRNDNEVSRMNIPGHIADICRRRLDPTGKNRLRTAYVSLPEIENFMSSEVYRKAVTADSLYQKGKKMLESMELNIDADKALRLIEAAANMGCCDALEKLAEFSGKGKYVKRDLKTAIKWQKKLVEQKEKEHRSKMTDSSSLALSNRLWDLGDWYMEIADYENCRKVYQRFYELNCETAEKFPTDDGAQRYIRIGEKKLGDMYSKAGDKDRALEYYERALEGVIGLLDRFSGDNIRNDARIACKLIVEIYTQRGDDVSALTYAKILVDVTTRFASEKPTAENRRDMWSATVDYGDVLIKLGRRKEALDCFEKALEIITELDRKNSSEDTLFSLGLNCERLGKFYEHDGNYEMAVKYMMDSVEALEKAAEKNGSINNLAAVRIAGNRLGFILRDKGHLSSARLYFEKSYKVQTKLVEQFMTLSDREMLSYICSNLGEICRDQKDKDKAKEYFEESIALRERIAEEKRDAVSYDELAVVYYNRARLFTPAIDWVMLNKAHGIWTRLADENPGNSEYARRRDIVKNILNG